MLPPGRGRRRVEPEVYAERVPIYDYVAESYDDHFARPVDRWEDERLAALLAPHVNGADVLDLGCGTGWVLDHLSPAHYIGVDASPGMLAVLHDKHPDAWTACLAVGSVEWKKIAAAHVEPVYDAAVATWAAHCFGDLQPLQAPAMSVAATTSSATATPTGRTATSPWMP
jgi:SAM-dependent methyltransferase